MKRDKALMNSLTVFTYLTTHYPKEVISLTQYTQQIVLITSCYEMTEQDTEDLSKQLDYLRIDGSSMSSYSFVSTLDGTTIKRLEVTWDYDE